MAYTLALLRTRADWTSRDCCRHECVGRAERGDSANGPNAQRRTSARHTHRQVLENRPRGSQGLLNRDSGMVLEVLYRSVQRGGNSGETLSSSDSPIMVAQACFKQEGAALPSKALALPFSRRPAGRSPSRKSLEREDLGEVVKPVPEGLSIGRVFGLWAIGLIHGAPLSG